MRLIYNARVQQDVSVALRYYDEQGGPELGDAFFLELTAHVELARVQPGRFHRASGELRRVNLERFPYHFLFRVIGETVRILVVRHNRRHPSFGSHRQ